MVLSSLYRSDAWPDPAGPAYVNAALRLETSLSPEEVMAALLAIEAGFGRQRSDDPALRYAPRSLDLDLLDYEGERREGVDLMLPHPRLDDRIFVLKPLNEIAPDWQHPLTGREIGELLAEAPGRADRLPFTGLSITGS